MYRITYQKSNGEIFYRIRNTIPRYRIGELTSIGWRFLGVEYEFKGDYYSFAEYKKLMNEYKKKHHLFSKFKRYIKQFNPLY